jgi:hypothetical protein
MEGATTATAFAEKWNLVVLKEWIHFRRPEQAGNLGL